MDVSVIQRIGKALYEAAEAKKIIEPFYKDYPDAGLKEAYQIQAVVVDQYLKHGFHISGRKLGYTDPAMQERMHLERPGMAVCQ